MITRESKLKQVFYKVTLIILCNYGDKRVCTLSGCRLLVPYKDGYILWFTFIILSSRWYHGNLKRAEAEDKLKDQGDFSFLVRKSESCHTDYSLSIR